jgi:thiol:disulfide interchange protein DsbA
MSFHPSWADLQLAYLTAETMGVAEQAHSKLFDALHKQHKRLNSIEEIAQWYADETGVDKNAFLSTADSFILDSKLRKADKMGYEMQATSTPTLVINGKYKAAKGKNRDDIMKILSFLIEKEGKTMGLIQ